MAGFDDRQGASKILRRHGGRAPDDLGGDGWRRNDSGEAGDDQAMVRVRRKAKNVCETHVCRDEYAFVPLRKLKDFRVAPSVQPMIPNVENLVSGLTQRGSQRPGQVFVDHKAHGSDCGVKTFLSDHLRRIVEGGQNIIPGELVFPTDLLVRHSAGELAEYELDGHAGTADHRFPEAN